MSFSYSDTKQNSADTEWLENLTERKVWMLYPKAGDVEDSLLIMILFYSIFTDAKKIKAEFKSDINTDTSMFPNSEIFEKHGNEILDLRVGEPDIKVRHIFKKFAEVRSLVFVLFCCKVSACFSH